MNYFNSPLIESSCVADLEKMPLVNTTTKPAQPEAEQKVAGPPPVTPPPPRATRALKPWNLAATFLLLLLAGFLALSLSRKREAAPKSDTTFRTAVVERRDFIRSLRITGQTEAVQFYAVIAPRLAGGGGQLVLTRLAEAGSWVKKGDLLAEFDTQAQLKTLRDQQAEYGDLVDQIHKKQSESTKARAQDETALKRAESDYARAQLEMTRNEVISRIDAEKNKLTLEENEAHLKQLRQTYDLKQRAREAEIRDLEIQRDRARNEMTYAETNVERLTIRSPFDGMIVLTPIWRSGSRGEPQLGDQVWTGFAFMLVVDPSAMRVTARVNQLDIPYLRPGQAVKVHLDAYPDLILDGHLGRIAAIATSGSLSDEVHTFDVTFSIQGSDPRLLPDLSAAVEVELEKVPEALVVPRDAVRWEQVQAFVWVKNGSDFKKLGVEVGSVNNTEATITSGLEAGTVVLRNPEKLKPGA